MTQTTSASVTELINPEVIDDAIIAYQYDNSVIAGHFRFKSLVGMATPVASFPRWVKDAHEDLATEGTAMTPVEMETTQVSVTVGRCGIAREPTETSLEDTVLGRARFIEELAMDSALLLDMAIDEDCAAEFANASGSVSDTGQPMELADLVEMIGTQRTNKAKGAQVFNLHDYHLKHIQKAQLAATSTTWDRFYTPNADGSEYGGVFMNAEMWASSLNPTANVGADRLSCVYSRGDGPLGKKFCAFGLAVARVPTTKQQDQVLEDSHLMATTVRYGVATIAANFATKGAFDNG